LRHSEVIFFSYQLITTNGRSAYTMAGRTCLIWRRFSWWWVLMPEGPGHSSVDTTVLDQLALPSQPFIFILSNTF